MNINYSQTHIHTAPTLGKEGKQGSLLQCWIQEIPEAWAETGESGLAKNRSPKLVQLKVNAMSAPIKQCPVSKEAKLRIVPHTRCLTDLGILIPSQLALNTTLLLAKKPSSTDYRPAQGLQEVKKQVGDIHPTVLNLHTLLSTLPLDRYALPPWILRTRFSAYHWQLTANPVFL